MQVLFNVCFFEFSYLQSILSFTVSLTYCFTVLQCWPLTNARASVCSDATLIRDATRAPLIAFCQHFGSLFKGLHGEPCIRLLLEGSLKAERERERGGRWNYCSLWNNGSCGATCCGAHMNGTAPGCVWVSEPGSPSKSPFPSTSQWTCTGSGLLGVIGQPLLSRTSKHINIYKSRASHWAPCFFGKRWGNEGGVVESGGKRNNQRLKQIPSFGQRWKFVKVAPL